MKRLHQAEGKKIKSFSTSLELNLEDILVKSFLIRFTSH